MPKIMTPLWRDEREDDPRIVTVSEWDSETELTYTLTMTYRYRVTSVKMEGRALGYHQVRKFPLKRLSDKAADAWHQAYVVEARKS